MRARSLCRPTLAAIAMMYSGEKTFAGTPSNSVKAIRTQPASTLNSISNSIAYRRSGFAPRQDGKQRLNDRFRKRLRFSLLFELGSPNRAL